jgi:hypothetical protein
MTTGLVFTPVGYGATTTESASSPPASSGGALHEAYSTASGISHKAETIGARIDMLNAFHMVRNAIGEFASTARREFIKDGKDHVKDQGEAGHRPS